MLSQSAGNSGREFHNQKLLNTQRSFPLNNVKAGVGPLLPVKEKKGNDFRKTSLRHWLNAEF